MITATSRISSFCVYALKTTRIESIYGFRRSPASRFGCKPEATNLLVTVRKSDAGFVFPPPSRPAKSISNQREGLHMSDIKAIETEYKNYRFRSRAEARWAIFLDTLGLHWEYEKEGYDLDGIWYLPDFWVPHWNAFLEVKGSWPVLSEIEKAISLAQKSQCAVYFLIGNPDPESHRVWRANKDGVMDSDNSRFRQCRRCPEIFLVFLDFEKNEYAAAPIGHPDVADYMLENPTHECADRFPLVRDRIERAFQAACYARFEHGEKGGTT
jgi:hypothetical protein